MRFYIGCSWGPLCGRTKAEEEEDPPLPNRCTTLRMLPRLNPLLPYGERTHQEYYRAIQYGPALRDRTRKELDRSARVIVVLPEGGQLTFESRWLRQELPNLYNPRGPFGNFHSVLIHPLALLKPRIESRAEMRRYAEVTTYLFVYLFRCKAVGPVGHDILDETDDVLMQIGLRALMEGGSWMSFLHLSLLCEILSYDKGFGCGQWLYESLSRCVMRKAAIFTSLYSPAEMFNILRSMTGVRVGGVGSVGQYHGQHMLQEVLQTFRGPRLDAISEMAFRLARMGDCGAVRLFNTIQGLAEWRQAIAQPMGPFGG